MSRWRHDPIAARLARFTNMNGECHEWTAARDKDGYGVIKDLSRHMLKAHRVAWALAYGDIPAGMMVCHHCDNPPCLRLDHLFLGTARDNKMDAIRKNRVARGERHPARIAASKGIAAPWAKLTSSAVRAMRAMYHGGGVPVVTIAKTFGTSPQNANSVLRRLSWVNLT